MADEFEKDLFQQKLAEAEVGAGRSWVLGAAECWLRCQAAVAGRPTRCPAPRAPPGDLAATLLNAAQARMAEVEALKERIAELEDENAGGWRTSAAQRSAGVGRPLPW